MEVYGLRHDFVDVEETTHKLPTVRLCLPTSRVAAMNSPNDNEDRNAK